LEITGKISLKFDFISSLPPKYDRKIQKLLLNQDKDEYITVHF